MFKLEKVKDSINQDYIAIDINQQSKDQTWGTEFQVLLNYFFKTVGNSENYNINLLKRNKSKYHITVFNVMECQKDNSLLKFVDYKISDINFKGIGSVKDGNNQVWYVIVQSKQLDKLRSDLNLPLKDFHITIGFIEKDIFKYRKDITTLIK
jgi:hypothetical protein